MEFNKEEFKIIERKEIDVSKKKRKEILDEFDKLQRDFFEQQMMFNKLLLLLDNLSDTNALQRQRQFGIKKDKPQSKEEINDISEAENSIKEKKKGGRKTGSKNFDKDYLEAHVDSQVEIYPDEYEKIKSDPSIIQLDDEISYKVTYTPAKYNIIKIIVHKYFDKNNSKFYQGIKENDVFPHSICTPELVINTCINKFLYGIPYYRQTETFLNNGLYISRQDLCNYQMRAMDILEPIYYHLKKLLVKTPVKLICADETTHQVIKTDKKQCYLWVYTTSFYDHPIYIYEHCLDRKKENITDFLDGYKGYLLTDAYTGYSNLPNIRNAYCWAHAQRKFTDIVKGLSNNQKKVSCSQMVIDKMELVFKEEAKFNAQKLTPNEIYEKRNSKEYLEKLNDVFTYLHSLNPDTGSALESAVNYILKREEDFKTYLLDGHIPMTNNISERAVKPFVIARKNFLFSFTENGASSSSKFLSLQQTCLANGINPEKYLIYLLKNIGNNPSEDKLNSLVPRNFLDKFGLFN